MTGFLASQNIVDIQDIIAVFVVVAIILHPLTRLREHPPRVPRGLVDEFRVTYPIGRRKMGGQGLERLWHVLETNARPERSHWKVHLR